MKLSISYITQTSDKTFWISLQKVCISKMWMILVCANFCNYVMLRYQDLPAFPYCKRRKAGRGLGMRLWEIPIFQEHIVKLSISYIMNQSAESLHFKDLYCGWVWLARLDWHTALLWFDKTNRKKNFAWLFLSVNCLHFKYGESSEDKVPVEHDVL